MKQHERPSPDTLQRSGALWPNSPRLFVICPSKTCRDRRDTHYTPGLPSFSGVRSAFLPCGTFYACVPDLQYNNSICCQPFVEAPLEEQVPRGSQVPLALRQNRIEPRFKILLAFGPQLAALHGQGALNRLDPPE